VTASLSAWHELLQLTAPDRECGVIFARGHFPDNPDAILARAQRRNQTGTIGLELAIDEETDFVQESAVQGMINLRWPYSSFRLLWAEDAESDKPGGGDVHRAGNSFAKTSLCSFVRDGSLYQILRITPEKLMGSEASSETASLAPYQSHDTSASQHQDMTRAPRLPISTVYLQVGGVVRIGCYSSSHTVSSEPVTSSGGLVVDANLLDQPTFAGPDSLFRDNYRVMTPADTAYDEQVLTLISTNHDRRLEIRVWLNRKRLTMTPRKPASGSAHQAGIIKHPMATTAEPCEYGELYGTHLVDLYPDQPVNVVATFTLVMAGEVVPRPITQPIEDETVQKHLGITVCKAAAYRLWAAILGETPGPETRESFKLNTIGRCVEEVLGVLTVPVKIGTAAQAALPSREPNGNRSQSSSSTEGNVQDFGIALVQNIMDKQVVDFESTL